MKRKILSLLLAVVTILALATACGGGTQESAAPSASAEASPAAESTAPATSEPATGDTRTVTDLAGREVTIPANVTKVAALCGPSYETVIMLGAESQVVMTGNGGAQKGWATVVSPEYASIPVCEDATAPNVEELVKLGTQVVLYWDAYPDVTQALEDAGIAVVVTQLDKNNINSTEEFVQLKQKEITLVGDVFGGDAVAKAAKWCSFVDNAVEKISSVTSQLSADQLPSVYYVRGPEALTIHGGQSYTRYLVDLAGGSLVSKDDNELLYDTTMEQVVNWDPQYIFMGRVNNIELITEDPAWSVIQAVKDKNVYVNLKSVGPTDYSTDCFLLMEQIAKTLHPDLFPDLDMTAEVKSYFKDFYDCEITDEQAQRVLISQDPA